MKRQEEFDNKLGRIRGWMRERKVAGVALSSQPLFAWATAGGDNHVVLGNDHGVGTLLVTEDRVTVLSNNIETGRLSGEEFKGLDLSGIEFWACPWHEDHVINSEIERRMGGRVWACDGGMGTVKVDEAFMALTYSLTESEIARYRKLGKDCSLAMEEALKPVRPGFGEQRVAGLMCERLWEHGARPHVILVASDERVMSHRHPIPKEKKIKKHLMAVLCGKRGGLIVSLTRMVHFGRKLPEELRRKHDAACVVDVAFNTATRASLPMKEVFAAGVAEYERQGFGAEWKLHHQGGPTGYQGRSFRGTPTEERRVLENQAYAWNPSIQGTKSEDTMLARGGKIEFLSGPTRAWPMVAVKRDGKTIKRADIKLV